MKTDRELLELAAKAAGYKGFWDEAWKEYLIPDNKGDSRFWRPLADNGDTLRLAIKLCMDLNIDSGHTHVGIGKVSVLEDNESNGSAEAATRRAVTRAAAAVGEAMP